jgi:hypothetical protein
LVFFVDPAFLAGVDVVFAAGFEVSVGWPAFGTAEVFGSGVVLTGILAAGTRGVGVGLAVGSVFVGIGTRITPPSLGMNGLPPFGSIVTRCPGGGMYVGT